MVDRNYYKKYEPVFGDYTIKKELGEGSFGKVFEIERTEFGKTYTSALKTITVPKGKGELDLLEMKGINPATYYANVIEKIRLEVELMYELRGHSNIVSYENHKFIPHDDGIGWDILIKMEELTPLIKYLKTNKLSKAGVVRMGIDICKALELCHKKDIIHRDVKLENIFVSNNDDFKLGDFGIAKFSDGTQTGTKAGTPSCMAPEVFNNESYGQSVDVYSLGIVMYTLLNDFKLPFEEESDNFIEERTTAISKRMCGMKMSPPSYCDKALASIILKACEFEPAKRYSTATEMKEALERYVFQSSGAAGIGHSDLDETEAADIRGIFTQPPQGSGSQRPPVQPPQGSGSQRPPVQPPQGSGSQRPPVQPPQGSGSQRPPVQPPQGSGSQKPPVQPPQGSGSQRPPVQPPQNQTGSGSDSQLNWKMIAIVIAAAIVLVIAGFAVFMNNSGGENESAGGSARPSYEEGEYDYSDDEDDYGDEDNYGDEDSGSAGSQIQEVFPSNIIIVSSDWDSDSIDQTTHRIEDIMYVRNQSGSDITALDFYISDVDGKRVGNGDASGEPFRAYGYIKDGEMGIMVARVHLEKNMIGEDFDRESYIIKNAYFNTAASGYDVPTGYFDYEDEENKTYDVTITNYNDFPVNSNAIIAAVSLEGNTIGDSDATGSISRQIKPYETYSERKVFVQPHLWHHETGYGVYDIYAIDVDFLAGW